VFENLSSILGGFPGGVRDHPEDLANYVLPYSGANEIGNRRRSLLLDPAHVMVSVDMNQNPLLCTGIAPGVVDLVMVLEDEDTERAEADAMCILLRDLMHETEAIRCLGPWNRTR
jgi:hypothetical protein